MDKVILAAASALSLSGLIGLAYGIGINLQGMFARGATDFGFITASILESALILIAGLLLAVAARKK